MKIVAAAGKQKVVMTRREWEAIGKKAGWNDAFGRAQREYDNRMPPDESGPWDALEEILDLRGETIAIWEKNKKNEKAAARLISETKREMAEIREIIDSGDARRAEEFLAGFYGSDDPT
jgi:hypothetical protein